MIMIKLQKQIKVLMFKVILINELLNFKVTSYVMSYSTVIVLQVNGRTRFIVKFIINF